MIQIAGGIILAFLILVAVGLIIQFFVFGKPIINGPYKSSSDEN